VPDEDLRDPVIPGERENGLHGIFRGPHFDMRPGLARQIELLFDHFPVRLAELRPADV